MRRSGNKVLIIVLVVIGVLAIAGGVFAYLYFATDTFRTPRELFAKYLTQNIKELSETTKLSKIEEIESKLKENRNEQTIMLSYFEPEESEAIGTITVDTQNDPISKKNYGKLGLSLDGMEEALEVEYMLEKEMYSLRFTNAVKQFLSVENKNLKELVTKLGAEEAALEQIPDAIDFEEISLKELELTEEEKNTEISKYSNLLYNNIGKDKYTKTKKVVITVNGKTVTTNAYTLTLNNRDVKNVLVKLIEALKQDEIILSKLQIIDEKLQEYGEEPIKESLLEEFQVAIDTLGEEEASDDEKIVITLYEQNKNAIRIKLEQDLENITLDTTTVEDKKQIDLKYTSMDEENTQLTYGATFIKENDNKLSINLNRIEGEEQDNVKIAVELVENGENTKIDSSIDTEIGKITLTRDIKILDKIAYKVTLDSSNNVVLNDLSAEKIQLVFNAVEENITKEYIEKLVPIIMLLGGNPVVDEEAEIEAFNSKFIEYKGTNKTAEEVDKLLNTVLNSNQVENLNGNPKYIEVTGDLNLDITEATIKEKAKKGKYYSVEFSYDEIGYLETITVSEEEPEL